LKKLIIKGMSRRYFSKKVVEWYQQHHRKLPWRTTKDPYKIWLSEIILQQTRVAQGLPYYERFLSEFPSIQKLAAAEEQNVLRLWQGLGYYTRARNLRKCARLISEEFKGKFPTTFAELQKLPGVGEYTAAAIASFAFQECVPVLDGNVFRVLSRIFGIDSPINSNEGKAVFREIAREIIPAENPDLHNQAVMEFGAMHCTPVNPDCHSCIFKSSCIAYKSSSQHLLPVKLKKPEKRKRYFHYLVCKKGSTLMMRRRDLKDIWHGLYDFPLVERKRPASVENILPEMGIALNSSKKNIVVTKSYKHILTHQTIHCKFFILPSAAVSPKQEIKGEFYSLKQIIDLPKPVLISRFLNDYAFYS
jgi:A/G-specific adenine glycosylase